jgi:eukaryotic-like serine/threonine-protein kinase
VAGPRSNVSWNPPEVFEEYRLMRPLGSGAMGKVYLARDQLLDRLVAIKFVADDVPSALARERFLREARAVARIQHPNVVAVFRTGILDDRPYLIEEFARGTSLDHLKLPFAWRRGAELALGLAKGLGAVHRHGVLHRDLKPANAILTDSGEVKLLDFGLAKLLESEPTDLDQPLEKAVSPTATTNSEFDPADTLPSPMSSRAPTDPNPVAALRQSPSTEITMPGTILGTPLYMAPELWTGDPASTRSDVYALGAVMFELFSGRPPFTGESVQTVMAQAVAKSAPSLAEFAPEVPPALVRVVDRCLRHDPGDRFPGGEAVESALEDALTDAAPTAPIPALSENPYVGLAAFQQHQRRLFFGRSAEIRTLVERLKNDRIVIVAGDSGVGKSSLCRAGVLPSLENALVFTVVPGREPLAMLESAISATFMSDDVTDLGDRLRQLTATANVILFVDQLEEIVTLALPAAARAFAEALVRLLARTPRLRLLASVRSDFLTRVAALGFDEELMRGLYLLRPLSAAGVRDAVVGPAKAAGVAFESESMVDELVQAGVQHGSLPLLQFALSELWDKRDRSRHLITAESLHQIGGVEGALNRHADRVLDELPHPQRDIARRVLTRFVTAEGTKASLTASDLSGLGRGAPMVVDALVRARLLTVREVEGGAVYELAHESMIRCWARIRSWLEADAERRQISERIARGAAEWKRLGHDDALWGEAQLADAARFELTDLGAQERAFLDASRGAIARQKLRRWGFLIGAPLALALAIGFANLQSKLATDARVDAIVERVQTDLRTGATDRVEIESALQRAFAAFDAHESAKGSEIWKRTGAKTSNLRSATRRTKTAAAPARARLRGESDAHVEALRLGPRSDRSKSRATAASPIPSSAATTSSTAKSRSARTAVPGRRGLLPS